MFGIQLVLKASNQYFKAVKVYDFICDCVVVICVVIGDFLTSAIPLLLIYYHGFTQRDTPRDNNTLS